MMRCYNVTRCGLPLCGRHCPSLASHRPECDLLSHAREMLILNSDKDVQQVSECEESLAQIDV